MSSAADGRRVLQVGFGNFGPTHLAAWRALGCSESLIIADPSAPARAACRRLGVPAARIADDYREHLDWAELVDVVSATDTHIEVASAALYAGSDVFLEKPLTSNLDEARELAAAVETSGRALQVGFYFRFHPLGRAMKQRLESGLLGEIRHLSSRFTGFKRGRQDSGVVLNDAIHFIDLHNWLLGAFPIEVQATLRDHFGRGFEDMAALQMVYPGGVIARIEAGCTLPGRWNDNIVAGATASKEITIAGSEGAIEADFVSQEMLCHQVRHTLQEGLWRPVFGTIDRPHIATAEPADVVGNELSSFLECIASGRTPEADVDACGVRLAEITDAIFRSDAEGRPVELMTG